MRERTLCRVDVLEQEERCRQLERQSSLATIYFFCWRIVLAYYIGDLKGDEDPGEAAARALNYASQSDYLQALFQGEQQEINERFKNAAHRVFAKVGLDFDSCSPRTLFESFVSLANQLPEQWMEWLKSNLQEECRSPIVTRSNLPIAIFVSAGEEPTCSDQDGA
jgi:hypothetical protein